MKAKCFFNETISLLSLTWWVSADVAGVFIRNIVFQQAHAGAMLPAQTVFTLREERVLISCKNPK